MDSDLERDGFLFLRGVLNPAEVVALRTEAARLLERETELKPHGVRNLCTLSREIHRGARGTWLKLVDKIAGQEMRPVRGILFDKVPGANWKVVWHQDRTIAVKERVELEGYGPWSVKAGVPHVEPPVELLEQMLTLRLHLDECGADNGALRVIAGSHLLGKLHADTLCKLRSDGHEVTCALRAGDALIMRPLLLHASGAAEKPHHRRVIHLEYAPLRGISPKLEWAM